MFASSGSFNVNTRHLCAGAPFAGCVLVPQREDFQVGRARSGSVPACMGLNECGCREERGGREEGKEKGRKGAGHL